MGGLASCFCFAVLLLCTCVLMSVESRCYCLLVACRVVVLQTRTLTSSLVVVFGFNPKCNTRDWTAAFTKRPAEVDAYGVQYNIIMHLHSSAHLQKLLAVQVRSRLAPSMYLTVCIDLGAGDSSREDGSMHCDHLAGLSSAAGKLSFMTDRGLVSTTNTMRGRFIVVATS